MTWQYLTPIFQAENLASLERTLQSAGDDGWELVTVIPHPLPAGLPPQFVAIFKRPAPAAVSGQTPSQ